MLKVLRVLPQGRPHGVGVWGAETLLPWKQVVRGVGPEIDGYVEVQVEVSAGLWVAGPGGALVEPACRRWTERVEFARQ